MERPDHAIEFEPIGVGAGEVPDHGAVGEDLRTRLAAEGGVEARQVQRIPAAERLDTALDLIDVGNRGHADTKIVEGRQRSSPCCSR